MTYRKKLTLSFFLILSIQTMLGIGLTYFSVAELLRNQKRTILEEGWNEQESRYNDIFKQITKDLYFYKFLIEEEINTRHSLDYIDRLLEKSLDNTVAHTAILYNSDGNLLATKKDGQQLKDFSILNSPYSLLDFKFPTTKISWSQKEDEYGYFGLISGTRIVSDNKFFYLIFFTDFKQHLQQISERLPEVLTVFSLEDRILYSDFPGVEPFVQEEREWSETKIGNDSFIFYGRPIWSNSKAIVTLSVLHSITAEKKMMKSLIRLTAIIFSFTWIVAFVIALKVSQIFSTPLINLNNSLKTYLSDGYFPKIQYNKENDLAFLISSFENLTNKIIYEETQIRSQMEQIQMLNEYNKNLIENIQSGIVVLNDKGCVEFCNAFISGILEKSRDKILGIYYKDLFCEIIDIDIPEFNDLIKISVIPGIHLSIIKNKIFTLKISPVFSRGHLEKLLLVLEDSTETDRKWEESLIIDRVSSLSMLSAGMAHEINNPLAGIQTNIDYLSAVETVAEKKESINWIIEGVNRISDIVSNATQYTMSVQSGITKNVVDTAQRTAHLLLSGNSRKKVKIEVSGPKEISSVKMQEDHFKQLVLNLMLNAIEASSDGHLIHVKFAYNHDKNMVVMSVIDQGKGIPDEILSKVFNPFFSYGKKNNGTGLGLSVCYGIVSRAGGKIQIESLDGIGTTVKVEMLINDNSDC